MSTFRRVFSSSVGTKLLIGTTGLLLFLFLIGHLAGNLLVLAGPTTFNNYSHFLVSNPLTIPVEIGLLLIALLHIYKTIANYLRNSSARPVGYEEKKWADYKSRKSVSSTTMIWTGLVTLVFIVIHLQQFKWGVYYPTTTAGVPMRDLYRTEAEVFSSPVWVAIYTICMVLIGFHLRHGIWSAFQSLGANHPTYTSRIRAWSTAIAIIIGGGFAIIPLWVYFAR